MAFTPAQELALEKMVRMGAEITVQLDKGAQAPFIRILAKARDQAALAIDSLVLCDPNDPDKIRGYQNEVRRYEDLVIWTQEIIAEGREADQRLAAADQTTFHELLTPALRTEMNLGGRPEDNDA